MLLAARTTSKSGVLVVRGEPGIGKSALLDHAVEHAEGLRALRATGVESEAELPYAGLHALLHPVLGLLPRLPVPHAHALECAFGLREGSVADRFLVSLGTLGLLSAAATEAGLLAVVDDAHWLDRASTDAIVFAARRLEAEGVVLLLAARTEDPRRLDAPGLPEITLGGLTAEAAAPLLGERVAPEVGARLIAVTGGNPLALMELPDTLTAEQLAGTAPIPLPLPVGAEVQRAFLGVLGGLSRGAQTVALLVAADDTQDRATIAAAARRLDLDPAVLEELESVGLVRVSGPRLELRHPLVRSAVYRGASSNARRAAHLALAEVLPGERSTWHRAAAADGHDTALAAELEAFAGQARLRSAHAAAATALERAATLMPPGADRARLLAQAAASSWDAGHVDRVEPLLEGALPLLDPDERDTLGLLRGDLALERGRPADAFDLLVAAAANVDGQLGMRMLARAAEAAWWLGEADKARALERMARGLAPEDGTGRMLTRFVSGTARVLTHEFEEGVTDLREALALAEHHGSEFGLATGYAALYAAELVASQTWFARLVSRLRAESNLRELPFAISQLAAMECWLGRLSTAASHGAEAMRLARETGQARSVGHAAATLAHVEAVRGREEAARAHAAEAIGGPIGGVALQASRAAFALGRLEIGLGRPEEALAHLLTVYVGGTGVAHPLVALLATADLAEAAARSGRREVAGPALATFTRWEDAARTPWIHSQASRARALLTEGDEAEEHFRRAIAVSEGAFPFDDARTRLLYGEWLRRGRRRVDARVHLQAALKVFDALGALPWADRARSELRATGAVAGGTVPRTLDELTPQELHIAQLVADGATNKDIAARLFLSVRTVEYHLQKTYKKLGITSRHALIRVVSDEGEAGSADLALPVDQPSSLTYS
jgi:DNA-binding CsgD family transcriptional regulator